MLVGLEKIHNEVQLHKSVCRPFFFFNATTRIDSKSKSEITSLFL